MSFFEKQPTQSSFCNIFVTNEIDKMLQLTHKIFRKGAQTAMDSYNSGNPIGLGPRQRKQKRKYLAKLFIFLALLLLPIGGYVIYQYLGSNQQQTASKSVQSLSEVPVANLDKALSKNGTVLLKKWLT